MFGAAGRTSDILKRPNPLVRQTALQDFYVVYELTAFMRQDASWPETLTELHSHILDVFNEHGVQIMTPAYEGDPAEPKVVAAKDWYLAPAARTAPAEAEGVEAARAGAETPLLRRHKEAEGR